jgi:hypothetical protein
VQVPFVGHVGSEDDEQPTQAVLTGVLDLRDGCDREIGFLHIVVVL